MVFIKSINSIKKSLISRFNPARSGVIQGVIATSKQSKKVFLHLYRCVRNCESRCVVSASFYTSIVVIQRRSTIFSEFCAFRGVEHLHMMLASCKAEVVVQRIHWLLDCLLFHCFDCYCKQLPRSRNVRSIRHISSQFCRTLTAIREQQNFASLIRKPIRITVLSWYSRLQLELRLDQVEERLITSSAKWGKLRCRKLMPTMWAGREGNDLRPAFCRVVAVVQFSNPWLTSGRVIRKINKSALDIKIT